MGRNKGDLDGSAKRFIELKQQIVAATGLPSDAPRISYLATLTLQAERLQSRVIAGDDTVTGAELLALRTTIEEISPATPHTVSLKIVDGTRKACPFCKATFNPHDDDPKPLPPDDDLKSAPAPASRTPTSAAPPTSVRPSASPKPALGPALGDWK